MEDELAEDDNSIPADPTVRNFSYTVLDDKKMCIRDRFYGRYFVKETKAPEGFVLDTGVYEVMIDTNGKMCIRDRQLPAVADTSLRKGICL